MISPLTDGISIGGASPTPELGFHQPGMFIIGAFPLPAPPPSHLHEHEMKNVTEFEFTNSYYELPWRNIYRRSISIVWRWRLRMWRCWNRRTRRRWRWTRTCWSLMRRWLFKKIRSKWIFSAGKRTYSKISNLPASGSWVVAMVAAASDLWTKTETCRLIFSLSSTIIIVLLVYSPGGSVGIGGVGGGQSTEILISK